MSPLDAAQELSDLVAVLEDAGEQIAGLTEQETADLWRRVKQASNALYGLAQNLGRSLLETNPNTRGWHFDDGRPVQVKRRFEIEILPGAEHEVDGWLKREGLRGIELKPSIPSDARSHIQDAVTKQGEMPPGVSAGYGNPFLALGR